MFKENVEFDEIQVGDTIERVANFAKDTVDIRRGVVHSFGESYGIRSALNSSGYILVNDVSPSWCETTYNILERPEVKLPQELGSLISIGKTVYMRLPSQYSEKGIWRAPGEFMSKHDADIRLLSKESGEGVVIVREGY